MLRNIFIDTLFVFAFMSTSLLSQTVSIPPGVFEISDNLKVLDRSEEINPSTGMAAGMIVFGPKGDLPRAVFIITYTPEKGTTPPGEALDAAVKIGNPFNPALTAKDAHLVFLGGAQAGSYSGILPNGLIARSFVVSNNGYRLTVLLKGPNQPAYKNLMDSFAAGLEHFRWAAPSSSVVGSIQPSTQDKPNANAQGSLSSDRSDRNDLLGLLDGDLPMTPDHLQTYLCRALLQPSPQAYVPAGQKQNDWGKAVGRLVFSEKEKYKSLEFWTSIHGGDHLKGILKKHGIGIDKFYGSTVLSGEPKQDLVPAIAAEVASWYSSKLRDRAQ